MSGNAMKARWAEGEPTFGGWCVTGSPFVAELLALDGFDYVCLDLQHGLLGYDSFLRCLYALARTGTTPTVRVPANDPAWIGKVLDAGAQTVIVPLVETREQAERAVAACRYFPDGARSVGSWRGALTLGNDPTAVNREVACLVMIETARGVEHADEICSVPGVDGVYVGPADLALTYGVTPGLTLQPGAHAEGVAHVVETCAAHGIVAGIQCQSGEDARRRVEQGFRMVTVCTDVTVLRSGARAQLAEARGATATPGGSYA